MAEMSNNKKIENLSKAFIESSLPGPEELVFDLSTQGGGEEETVGFVIADDSDDDVEQSIVFGGEASLPSPEEAKIDAMNRASDPMSTASASDDEEEYFQEEEEEDGHSICLGPSLGPAWSGSILAPDDAKVGDTHSWGNSNRYGPCCSARRCLWLSIILAVLFLATGFYVGYIKDKLLEKIQKDLESHDFNDRGTITLTSTAFGHGEPIPIRHSADGANVSPPLSWSKLPAGTQSLVLMADDHVTASPIKQHGNDWSHWVVYDIPPTFSGFRENLSHDKKMSLYSEEARKELTFYQGINSWGDGSHGYKGPDPSRKTGLHYYVFTLYALDTTLGLDPTNTAKGKVLRAMESVNILGYGKLIGTYQRFNRG